MIKLKFRLGQDFFPYDLLEVYDLVHQIQQFLLELESVSLDFLEAVLQSDVFDPLVLIIALEVFFDLAQFRVHVSASIFCLFEKDSF